MTTFLSLERKRLGLTQTEVYEPIKVSKSAYLRWEQGKPIPSDKLAELESIGFDIRYIVTGKRQSFEMVNNDGNVTIDNAIEIAKYSAREAIKSVYQVKKLRKEVNTTSDFDVIKSLELVEKAVGVLALAEITGELNTDVLFEALQPTKKQSG
ncbi:helix-turn-helix transcriptional regulator [Pseudoalteromonas sp. MMG012]|uniref:helix-turn-helix domain-containing protein n=1 Tax=Pseudoalteromonas sp. MMG012 TaxID=2822686 RepID=UPI001B3A48BF|nr:helix-turn-helix transcriptional regulator [Pseudoalteromonas sp. MMG012]MBQ4852951.1 helix-turn-helix transcriptional regulator [Pseudoalteromonas sp. MMG012]